MLKPGNILINRYQVIKALGQGGQSNVYLMKDLRLKGKKWVGKEMVAQYSDPRDQSLARKHFEQEATILANLEHPNLPKVIDYFAHGGKYYLIMEYLKGDDLGRMIEKRKKPFGEDQIAEWAIQIATVLYYLHCQKQPIIFRDIKPSNVMICGGQVKLIDFGIARHFNPQKKGDTLRIGSPGYSPPEQYSGQTDQRSDIYSLGVTMHHLITAEDPSKSKTPFKLPPVRAFNKDVSTKMVYIIEKATQLDPGKRYNTAKEMKQDLKDLLGRKNTQPAILPAGAATVPNAPIPQAAVTKQWTPDQMPQGAGATVPVPPPAQGALTVPTPGPAGADDKAPSTKFMPGDVDPNDPQAAAVDPNAPSKPTKKKKKNPIAGIIVMVIIFGIIGGGLFMGYKNIDTIKGWFKTSTSSPSPTASPSGPVIDDSALGRGEVLYKKGKYREALLELKKAAPSGAAFPELAMYMNNTYVLATGANNLHVALITIDKGKKSDDFLAGAVIAQEKINGEGGIRGQNLVIDLYRLQGDARKDKKVLEEVFAASPIAILSNADLKASEIVRKKADELKVPFLALANSKKVKASENAGLLTWSFPEQASLKASAAAIASMGEKKVILIHESGIDPEKLQIIQKALSDEKIDILMTSAYQGDKLNFDAILAGITDKKPDALFVMGGGSEIGHFISILEKSGSSSRIYIPDEKSGLFKDAETELKEVNIFTFSPLFDSAEDYPAGNFVDTFSESFKDLPRPGKSAALGYDLLRLAVFAGRKSAPEGEKMLSYLKNEKLTGFKGALGEYRIDSGTGREFTGIITPRFWAVKEFKNGTWQQRKGIRIQ